MWERGIKKERERGKGERESEGESGIEGENVGDREKERKRWRDGGRSCLWVLKKVLTELRSFLLSLSRPRVCRNFLSTAIESDKLLLKLITCNSWRNLFSYFLLYSFLV